MSVALNIAVFYVASWGIVTRCRKAVIFQIKSNFRSICSGKQHLMVAPLRDLGFLIFLRTHFLGCLEAYIASVPPVAMNIQHILFVFALGLSKITKPLPIFMGIW